MVLKDIKNIHLSVYPPAGKVRISAPSRMTLDTIRVFAISKLSWIKQQQEKINALQNAGLMDVQRAKFAALKAEFAAVTSGQGQSAPLKARS